MKTLDNTTVVEACFSEHPGVRRHVPIAGSSDRFDGAATMASVAPFTTLKGVDQDAPQIHHDFTGDDIEAVIETDRETGKQREPMVGLWFWAIE